MKQYLDLLQNIIDNGVEKESGRENMPNTIGISKADISMDMKNGFPLLTTKKMYWKGIVHELLWFLRGETNIKYLVDNNVNIWNGDAYRWYLKWWNEVGVNINEIENIQKIETIEEFVDAVKKDTFYEWEKNGYVNGYKLGDLGKVYGYQWRDQNGVDQVKDVFDGLNDNPYSRYHIIDGWNKADFSEMALPPCHLLYQFIVRPLSLDERQELWNKKNPTYDMSFHNMNEEDIISILNESNIPKYYLDLNMYQRSCDTFLGVPFNIASMSLFLILFAKAHNMVAGVANWIGGDTHLYVSHIETAKEQIDRTPYDLPTMKINKDLKTLDDILNLTIDDFELVGYQSHPTLKAELFTGLKK